MGLRLVCVLVVVAGCSNHHGSGGGDAGGSGSSVTALAIAPPQASVDLVAAGSGFAATQPYTVTATFEDGTTADVTAQVIFGVPDASGITFGGATATATIAGSYAITAQLGSQLANATLTARLTGSAVLGGITPTQQGVLDGSPAAGQTPVIAYPPAGALFPINVAPLEVHAHKSDPSQAIARVTFTSGANLAFSYYAPCGASPDPTSFPDACIVTIGGSFATQLAGVSEDADVSITIRLAAPDGSMLGESQPLAAAWAKTPLTGGLYYWTTAGTGDTTFNTAIARYDFDGDASTPTIYLSSADAPAVPSGQPQCVGCHSVSPDGTKLAFSLGGSLPGYFSMYDVASRTATATEMTDKYANMSTFSPDGTHVITASYGALTLRTADATLAASGPDLFPEVTEQKSHPFWGPSGSKVAFVSWVPSSQDQSSGHVTGDMVEGAQIWIAPSDGAQITGQATLLVPRQTGVTSYYPAISDDDQLVVFDQSSCSGPANTPGGWGAGACDGYNDISAMISVVPAGGGSPVVLTRANGGANPLATNSWPRWSPDHGTFRGKRLYWVAFSSRRPYGLALRGSTSDTTKPQLWFAAVAVDASGALGTDPSYPAVWLPGQDPSLAGPRGNHTPAWTSRAVVIQ